MSDNSSFRADRAARQGLSRIATSLARLEVITPETLAIRNSAWKTLVIDFRSPEAHASLRIPDSICLPLADLHESVAGLPLQTQITVVCNSGEQSRLAASILCSLNYRKVSILEGGFEKYLESQLPLQGKDLIPSAVSGR